MYERDDKMLEGKNATIFIDEKWEKEEKILKEMAETERILEMIRTDMNVQLEKIKEETSEQCAPIYARQAELAATLENYANKRRGDFINPKSRPLIHGTIGFRRANKLLIPKDEAVVIQKLEKLGHGDCVIVTKTLDKSRFKKLPKDILKKAGATISTGDFFFYKINKEAVVDHAQ